MGELRYPNESREYRDARDSLLKDEQELVDKVKSVAERRRNLPPGGQLKEDYVFQWANDGKVGQSVKFSELFGDKNTLLLYSFMFGPNWDNPCPSCTSLVDGFDRTWYQVTQDAAFVAIAKAPAERINAWAKQRGWSQIALVSGSDSPYQADYKCQGDTDDMQLPVMHVFRKQDGKIFHFWGTESMSNHRRHGMGVLESHGLYARGPARHSHPATKFQVRIPGETLSEQGVESHHGRTSRAVPQRSHIDPAAPRPTPGKMRFRRWPDDGRSGSGWPNASAPSVGHWGLPERLGRNGAFAGGRASSAFFDLSPRAGRIAPRARCGLAATPRHCAIGAVRPWWLTVRPDPGDTSASARWGASCPRQGNPPTHLRSRLLTPSVSYGGQARAKVVRQSFS